MEINPGYAGGQQDKAAHTAATHPDETTRSAARDRVAQWQQVIDGMADGTLTIGSRTPVAGIPVWVTQRVLRGGFSTGRAVAAAPPQRDEKRRAERLGIPAERRAIFESWLTADGLAELEEMLTTRGYSIHWPQHAMLPTVAVLLRRGDHEAARRLLDEVEPFVDSLRFAPPPAAPVTLPDGHVFRATTAEVRDGLRAMRPKRQVAAEHEALTVWTPLTDEAVSLWARILDDPAPTASDLDAASGLIASYETALQHHTRCRRYRRDGETLPVLVQALRHLVAGTLTDGVRDRVRHRLARIDAKRGLPGSTTNTTLRQHQAAIAARPLHQEIAVVLAARLDRLRGDIGITDLADALTPIRADEATDRVPAGTKAPPGAVRIIRQGAVAEIGSLVELGALPSVETLARLVPQLTAAQVSARVGDGDVGALLAATYRAFRRTRSLLLLNLESQTRFEEFPWVAALLEGTPGAADDPVGVARRLATLAVEHFPGTLLPNPLVRELGMLLRLGGVELPLTEELAVDIFMGRFTPKFQRAAKVAADLLQGTLYEAYHGLDLARVAALPEPVGREVPAFDELCRRDAVPKRSLADNGRIIERQQILTAGNLAVLTSLGVEPRDGWGKLALRAARHAFRLLRLAQRQEYPQTTVKNAAIAWRQALFCQAMSGDDAVVDAIVADPLARQWPPSEVVAGLAACRRGETVVPLTGWDVGGVRFHRRRPPDPT